MSIILSDTEIPDLLQTSKVIAVIGCSPKPHRTSNRIARFLIEQNYEVIPVNPGHDKMLDRTCYRSIADIPENIRPDIFNVFRNKAHTADFMKEVIRWKENRDHTPVVWTQLDVSSAEAEMLAEDNSIPYVRNKCIMVEINY